MRKTLKKYFVPHSGNDFRPHMLRERVVVLLMLIILGLPFLTVFGTQFAVRSPYLAEIFSSALVALANSDRAASNLPALAPNAVLEDAARLKAEDMAKKSYFAHVSPEGITPWHWFSVAGYSFSYAGENLAVNFADSTDVERAWMDSLGHRANILNEHFVEVGIATAHGIYKGKDAVFVVELFGRPTPKSTAGVEKPASAVSLAPVPVPASPAAADTGTNAVAGLETVYQDSLFAAVRDAGAEEVATAPTPPQTAHTPSLREIAQQLLAAPRRALFSIYLALAALIALAVVCSIAVGFRRQHPRHVFYGLALLGLLAIATVFGGTFIFPLVGII